MQFPLQNHGEEMIYYGALLNTTFSKRRIQACGTVSLKRCLLHKGKNALQRGTRVAFPKKSHSPAGSTLWTLKKVLWIFMRRMVCHGIRRPSSLMDQRSLLEYFFPWFSRKVHKNKDEASYNVNDIITEPRHFEGADSVCTHSGMCPGVSASDVAGHSICSLGDI